MAAQQRMMPGGTGPVREADAEVQAIADQVRPTVEQQSGRQFKEFTAVQYRTQVVAGINYFIKVHVGDTEYVHLRVYRNLQWTISLAGFQLSKTEADPLEHFLVID